MMVGAADRLIGLVEQMARVNVALDIARNIGGTAVQGPEADAPAARDENPLPATAELRRAREPVGLAFAPPGEALPGADPALRPPLPASVALRFLAAPAAPPPRGHEEHPTEAPAPGSRSKTEAREPRRALLQPPALGPGQLPTPRPALLAAMLRPADHAADVDAGDAEPFRDRRAPGPPGGTRPGSAPDRQAAPAPGQDAGAADHRLAEEGARATRADRSASLRGAVADAAAPPGTETAAAGARPSSAVPLPEAAAAATLAALPLENLDAWILNAAMIPGWPAPRRIVGAGEEAAPLRLLDDTGGKDPSLVGEAALVAYLAAQGIGEAVVGRIRQAVVDADKRWRILVFLARLAKLLKSVAATLERDLASLEADLAEAERLAHEGVGGRRRRRRLYME
ncbi:hypothetical protein [Prosthecomicrobium sp. N25]|uniref:hypothetical protein n=1 Tax=Prosthecomicrobium sp. N25 TaxID=3129254 RepID=UPI00307844B6